MVKTTVKNERWWTMRSTHEFKIRFGEFMSRLEPFIKAKHKEKLLDKPEVLVAPGLRYMRVMLNGKPYCMIERQTGDIFKACGKRSVTGESRGNIFSDDYGLSVCGVMGIKSKKLRPGGPPGHLAKPEDWVLVDEDA